MKKPQSVNRYPPAVARAARVAIHSTIERAHAPAGGGDGGAARRAKHHTYTHTNTQASHTHARARTHTHTNTHTNTHTHTPGSLTNAADTASPIGMSVMPDKNNLHPHRARTTMTVTRGAIVLQGAAAGLPQVQRTSSGTASRA